MKKEMTNLNKFKCLISEDDDFKLVKLLSGDTSSLIDGENILAICSGNHINRIEIARHDTENEIDFALQWYDFKLQQIAEKFLSIRRKIPDRDRELIINFLSFCNIGEDGTYAAAVAARAALEEFLIDVYLQRFLSYMESSEKLQYKEHYKNWDKYYKKNLEKGEDSITPISRYAMHKINTSDLIKKIEKAKEEVKDKQKKKTNGNSTKDFFKYFKEYLNKESKPYLFFDDDGGTMSNLWRLTSSIIHGNRDTIDKLMEYTLAFLNALGEHLNGGLEWKT